MHPAASADTARLVLMLVVILSSLRSDLLITVQTRDAGCCRTARSSTPPETGVLLVLVAHTSCSTLWKIIVANDWLSTDCLSRQKPYHKYLAAATKTSTTCRGQPFEFNLGQGEVIKVSKLRTDCINLLSQGESGLL